MKNVIMQVRYFQNDPMTKLMLYCHIFTYWEKKDFLREENTSIILPLKSKLSGKFQHFDAIDGSIEMLKNSYSCGNAQNKPKGRCYGDVFNQMYILMFVLSNTTINISTTTNFEQILADFSINWLCKAFQQANFRLGFKEIGIGFEQVL